MKNTRYFLFGLSAVCVCMIGITSLNGSLLNPLRNAVGYVLVPIQSGINAVGGSIYKEASALGSLKDAMKENETLKAQVDELTEENTRLRAAAGRCLLPEVPPAGRTACLQSGWRRPGN